MALVQFYGFTLEDARALRVWEANVLISEMDKTQKKARQQQRKR